MLRRPSRRSRCSPAESQLASRERRAAFRRIQSGGTLVPAWSQRTSRPHDTRDTVESWTPGLGIVLPSGAETRPGVQLVRRTAHPDTTPRTFGALQHLLCGRAGNHLRLCERYRVILRARVRGSVSLPGRKPLPGARAHRAARGHSSAGEARSVTGMASPEGAKRQEERLYSRPRSPLPCSSRCRCRSRRRTRCRCRSLCRTHSRCRSRSRPSWRCRTHSRSRFRLECPGAKMPPHQPAPFAGVPGRTRPAQ
jgi:hypothetical protein